MQADPNQQTRAQRLLHFPPTRGLLPCGPVGACLQLLSHMKYPFLISSSPTTPCTSFVTLAWSRLVGLLHSPVRPACKPSSPASASDQATSPRHLEVVFSAWPSTHLFPSKLPSSSRTSSRTRSSYTPPDHANDLACQTKKPLLLPQASWRPYCS